MNKLGVMAGVVLVALAAGAGGVWEAGSSFSTPANHAVGPAPEDLGAQDVEFSGVKGWLIAKAQPSPCIVLMHGVGGDRRNMEDRARLFRKKGFSVLLFDFQAHGESPGEKITFGYREAANAAAAVDFIRSQVSCTSTVALGVSMGGAAALLGPQPLPVDALILESVYPTIEEAVQDRMVIMLGPLGRPFAPLLYQQIPLRLNIPLENMRPISHIGSIKCPVLIMAGDADRHTTPPETLRLLDQAPGPKSYWMVPGAAHVDLYAFAGAAYERHVLRFLAQVGITR
jgi:fermentation-respiration switch protein FrsA (DUF1100 family)